MNSTTLLWKYKGFIKIRAKKVMEELASKGDILARGYLKKMRKIDYNPSAYLNINRVQTVVDNSYAKSHCGTNHNATSALPTYHNTVPTEPVEEIFVTKRYPKKIKIHKIDYYKQIFHDKHEREIYNSVPFFALDKDILWNKKLKRMNQIDQVNYYSTSVTKGNRSRVVTGTGKGSSKGTRSITSAAQRKMMILSRPNTSNNNTELYYENSRIMRLNKNDGYLPEVDYNNNYYKTTNYYGSIDQITPVITEPCTMQPKHKINCNGVMKTKKKKHSKISSNGFYKHKDNDNNDYIYSSKQSNFFD